MDSYTFSVQDTDTSKIEDTMVFNPFSPEFRVNPYPIYSYFRFNDPVHRTRSFSGEWLLTRNADVKTALTSQSLTEVRMQNDLEKKAKYLSEGNNFNHLIDVIEGWLFFLQPPNHTRLRGLVGKFFLRSEVENLRPYVQEIVDNLLNKFIPNGKIDVINDFAAPLPIQVSAKMLGVPDKDRSQLTQWSYDLFRVFDQPMSLKGYQQMNEAAYKFKCYFSDLIDAKKDCLDNDLISILISAANDEKLNKKELISFCAMLFSVGQETTENLIGNGMLALLQNPDQMEKLKHNPQLIQSAVEEFLRYDSPVQMVARLAKENLEIGGKKIMSGERVCVALGAANRDPEVFLNPNELDITRKGSQTVSFGYGLHFCLGSALSRIQGEVAINTLVQRLSEIKIATQNLEWRKNIILRGLESLPISFAT